MRLPETGPRFEDVTFDGLDEVQRVVRGASPVDDQGRYLHWEQVRRRPPPDGLSNEKWWVSMQVARQSAGRTLPLRMVDGTPLSLVYVDEVQRGVHAIDQEIGGRVGTSGEVSPTRTRRYVRSLEEEAITSSQLEGATTTRRIAKRMLATGRSPQNTSEQMIVNNYEAMNRVKEMAGAPLTPQGVLDLHRIITEGTLDDPDDAGRLQHPGEERIVVLDALDGAIVHEPPPAIELPGRLRELCAFANGATGDGFLHPVVRAIVLHFMLSYDHPFRDGNGRTARALFYWSLLDSGYALAEYVSISSLLRRAPAQYSMAFQYTESDAGDVTYFVLHQLDVLQRAVHALWAYVERRAIETAEVEQLVRRSDVLNQRQLALIRAGLNDPHEPVTIAEHQHVHGVTNETARSDLLALERLDLYEKRKRGREFVFWPKPRLEERLRGLGEEAP